MILHCRDFGLSDKKIFPTFLEIILKKKKKKNKLRKVEVLQNEIKWIVIVDFLFTALQQFERSTIFRLFPVDLVTTRSPHSSMVNSAPRDITERKHTFIFVSSWPNLYNPTFQYVAKSPVESRTVASSSSFSAQART